MERSVLITVEFAVQRLVMISMGKLAHKKWKSNARNVRLERNFKREMKSLKALDQLHRESQIPDKQSMNMSGSGFSNLNGGLTVDGHDDSKSV